MKRKGAMDNPLLIAAIEAILRADQPEGHWTDSLMEEPGTVGVGLRDVARRRVLARK